VTREREFEQALADWIEDGFLEAPDRPIRAAIAHARAHPRRRFSFVGLGRALMDRIQMSEVKQQGAHRGWLVAVGVTAVVGALVIGLIGTGVVSFGGGPNELPAVGAPAGTATPAAAAATPTPDEALAKMFTMFDAPYSPAQIAALYAPDAVLHDTIANETSTGLAEIQAKLSYLSTLNFHSTRTSATIRQGDFVAFFETHGEPGYDEPGLVVVQLKDGKIVNQWVYGAP